MLDGFIDGSALVSQAREKLLSLLDSAVRGPGYVKIYFQPSLDGALAAGIAFHYLERGGLRVAMRPGWGCGEDNSIHLGVDSGCRHGFHVSNRGRKTGETATGVSVPGSSLTSIVLSLLRGENRIRPPKLGYAVIIAAYSTRTSDWGSYRLSGLDRHIAEELHKDGVLIREEGLATIPRLLGEGAGEALRKSIMPFLPGMTGRNTEELLGKNDLDPSKSFKDMEPEEFASLMELVIGSLRSKYRRRGDYLKSLIAGEVVIVPEMRGLWDLREASIVLEALMETRGFHIPLLYVSLDYTVEEALYKDYLGNVFNSIVDAVYSALDGGLERLETVRGEAWLCKGRGPTPPTTLWRILVTMGQIGEKSLVFTERKGRLCTSYLQILSTQRVKTIPGCAELVDGGLICVDSADCILGRHG